MIRSGSRARRAQIVPAPSLPLCLPTATRVEPFIFPERRNHRFAPNLRHLSTIRMLAPFAIFVSPHGRRVYKGRKKQKGHCHTKRRTGCSIKKNTPRRAAGIEVVCWPLTSTYFASRIISSTSRARRSFALTEKENLICRRNNVRLTEGWPRSTRAPRVFRSVDLFFDLFGVWNQLKDFARSPLRVPPRSSAARNIVSDLPVHLLGLGPHIFPIPSRRRYSRETTFERLAPAIAPRSSSIRVFTRKKKWICSL